MKGQEKDLQKLGLQGAMKAVSRREGRGEPKIGVEELMSLVDRFGVSSEAQRKIKAVLLDEDWGEGPFLANYYSGLRESKVQAYERTAREVFGSKYSIGVSSGTGALHAAMVAVGIGPGTEVICPAIGFMATAAAVVQAKGIPIFCDVDVSLAINPEKIEELITPRTVAIVPTHVMGSVCDMEAIMKIAKRHRLAVIEDCAQCCGGSFKGELVGTIGDIGVFSISAYKVIGGGEGGLLLTDDRRLWERASQVVETGGLWRPIRFAQPQHKRELFSGTNYRMSELEAAVDVVQLGKLEAMARRFRTVKERIVGQLKSFREIEPQKINDPNGEVGYLLRFYPDTLQLSMKIAKSLKARGVEADTRGKGAGPDWHLYSYMYPVILKIGATEEDCPFSCPIYRERGGEVEYKRGDCPVADDLFGRMVSIKLNQWYTGEDCCAVARAINEVLGICCTENERRNSSSWSGGEE